MTTVPARRTTPLLAAALLSLLLTGCGAGLNAQTYRERTAEDATNANVGVLALRDAAILPPAKGASELTAGSDATLTLSVVNSSPTGDTLLSVSSPAAAATQLVDGGGRVVPSVDVPPHGSVDARTFAVLLRGLAKPLRPAMYVEVTFVFDHNGRVTFRVPVKLYTEPVPRDSYAPKHQAE